MFGYRMNHVFRTITIILGLVALLAMPAAAQEDNTAKEKFNEGIEAASAGKTDAAIAAYQAAIAADASFADPYLNLGVIYFEQKNYTEAVKVFKKYTELEPKQVNGFKSLGYACIETKDIETGAAAFEAGLALEPKNAELLEGYADLYFDAGNWTKAIERFNSYIPVNPKDTKAMNDLAQAYLKAGRPGDAVKTYDQALKMDPNYWMAHFQLGSMYLDQKEYDKAATEFEKSAKINKKHWKSFYNLGIARQALETQEDYIEAYHAYSTFLKLTAGTKSTSVKKMRTQASTITKQLKDYFDAEGLDYE